jgi:hypothetical protein
MNPDGMSYLDMGTAIWDGDWSTGINGYWSPLYPALTGIWLGLLQPAPASEFVAVHLLNYGIYLLALLAFTIFLRSLWRYTQSVIARRADKGRRSLGEVHFLVLGYAIFLWTTIKLVSLRGVGPDLLALASFYASLAVLTRIRDGWNGAWAFAILGITLGLGYLAKAPMLPLGLVLLVVAAWGVRPRFLALKNILLASLTFAAVAGPWVFLISQKVGRLTISEGPRLNHVWFRNGHGSYVLGGYWEPAAAEPYRNSALHPIRQVHAYPTMYEFGTPIRGTYPPWMDPGYWYEGLEPTFTWRAQLEGIAINARRFLMVLSESKSGLLLLALFVVGATLLGWRRIAERWEIVPYMFLILPALIGLSMFLATVVESRYIAGFLATLFLVSLASVRLPVESRLPVHWFSAGVLLAAIGLVLLNFRGEGRPNDRQRFNQELATVGALANEGVGPGAPVGVIGGPAVREYWARLARVHLVAEIPHQEGPDFWKLDEGDRREVLKIFASSGAIVLVARDVPASLHPVGWQRIGDGSTCIYILTPRQNGQTASE